MALKIDFLQSIYQKLTDAFNSSSLAKEGGKLNISRAFSAQNLLEVVKKEGTKTGRVFTSFSGAASATGVIITSSVAFAGNSNVYAKKFVICSDKDGTFQMNVTNGQGMQSIGGFSQKIKVKAFTPKDVEYDNIIPFGSTVFLSCISIVDPTGTMNVDLSMDGWELFQNTDYFAPYAIMGWGDSIIKGFSGTANALDRSYFALVVKYFKNKKYRVKGINKGVSGATAEDVAIQTKTGYLDVDNANLILICVGMNVSSNLSAFSAALGEILDYKQNRYPDVVALVMAPTTRLDATEATLATYRPAIQAAVTARNDQKIKYLDLSLSFNAAAGGFGVTAGDVHPNDAGHAAIGSYINAYLSSNNIEL